MRGGCLPGNLPHPGMILLAPPFERGAYQVFSCSFSILLQIQGVNDSSHVDVFKEFPNTVACYYDYFVVFGESVLAHFWKSVATNRMRDGVTERPGHCESRDILVLQPDTKWSQRVVILVSEGINAPTVGQDSVCFIFVIWFVITSQSCAIHASSWISSICLGSLSDNNSSRITDISHI